MVKATGPTLKANGPVIDRLIREMKTADPSISFTEICERTRDLGPGFDYMSERTLRDARNSENVTLTRVHALAKVLGVHPKQITLDELIDEGTEAKSIALKGTTFVLNFPAEIMQTEQMQLLSTLPSSNCSKLYRCCYEPNLFWGEQRHLAR